MAKKRRPILGRDGVGSVGRGLFFLCVLGLDRDWLTETTAHERSTYTKVSV